MNRNMHKTPSTQGGNTTIIIGLIVLLAIFAGAYFFTHEAEAPEDTIDDMTTTTADSTNPAADDSDSMVDDDNAMGDVTIVTYTASGFSPKEVTISVGDTVRFENESGPSMWVASAMHPTHTVYPDTDIKKCGTDEEAGIFDACRDYEAGTNWDYTFTEAGEWGYHNHSRASHFGKVIVE